MDWIELIIFAVVVLFGLLAGDKKKSRRQQLPPRHRTRPSPSATQTSTRPRPAQDPRTIAEQILERMQQAEAERRAPPPQEAPLDPMHTSEAISLETEAPETYERDRIGSEIFVREIDEERDLTMETLEEAGTASHQRFHDRYLTSIADVPSPVPVPRVRMTPRRAREAFVLMAVLGRPKGLE